MKKTTVFCIFAILFIFTLSSFAQGPEITNGLNYLYSTQNPDGSWDNAASNAEGLPATVAAIGALQELDETLSQNYIYAVLWLQGLELDMSDDISNRLNVLAAGDSDMDMLLSYLDGIYSGAWGGYEDFEANNLDTVLALTALRKINYSDIDTVNYAFSYLIDNQNTDGGFGFYAGDDSNVYMSALALKVLAAYNDIFDFQDEVNDTAAYLLAKQNADGGFGSSPSTVYETSIAFNALTESGLGDMAALMDAINYLTINQLTNGSWDDDPYSTALALSALRRQLPNLSVSPDGVALSPQVPQTGSTVDILADVTNAGLFAAQGVTVRFSVLAWGETTPALIGEVDVPSVNARDSVQVRHPWDTTGITGSAVVIIEADPYDTIQEFSETDNTAEKTVYIGVAPNLTVFSEDSTITPAVPHPDEPFTASFNVHNTGEIAAENVTVTLHRQEPLDETGNTPNPGDSVFIGEQVIELIEPGGSASVQWELSLPIHWHLLKIEADPENTIPESSEYDNIGETWVSVIPAEVDLVINSNLHLLPMEPREREQVTIIAEVHNYGGLEARDIEVEFYDGEPGEGGALIDRQTIEVLAPMEQVVVSAITTLSLGEHSLYAIVDPVDTIVEVDETNNQAVRTVQVAPAVEVDFVITDSDITVNPALSLPGDTIDISAVVSNTGVQEGTTKLTVYDGDPRLGGTLITGLDITITANSSTTVQFSWVVPNRHATLFFLVDEEDAVSEDNENNNRAHKRILINRIDLAVSDDLIKTAANSYPVGETFAVRGLVRNLGGIDAADVLVQCYNGDPDNGGTLINSESIPSLAAGINKYVICFTEASAETNEIFYIVDPDNTIQEMLETNNKAGKIIYGIDPDAPDIAVTMFNTYSLVTDDQSLAISGFARVTLENPSGNNIQSAFDLAVFEDTNLNERYDHDEDNILGMLNVSAGLEAGEISNLSIPVMGSARFAGNRIFIMADSQNQVIENNEENNLSHDRTGCILRPDTESTFDIREEWAWKGSSLTPPSDQVSGLGVVPVIANLTDDNSDGLVDENDVPDILFITSTWFGHTSQRLRAVSGDTGEDIFEVGGGYISNSIYQNPAVADIDLDGLPEILIATYFGQVACYENDGTFKWISDNSSGSGSTFNKSTISVGDVEGDGIPEILYRGFVFNNDGTTKLSVSPRSVYGHSIGHVLADLDMTEDKEIIMNNSAYSSDGAFLWTSNAASSGYCAVGNFDGDPFPEVACTSSCYLDLLDHNGDHIWRSVIPGQYCVNDYNVGKPLIADFDGDGEPEIAVNSRDSVTVFETDGTVKWSYNMIGRIGGGPQIITIVAFDLNSDDKYEIIYRGMDWLHILDGETGDLLYQTEVNLGSTSVADVDNDGQVEIVLAGRKWYNGDPYYGAIRVLGSARNNWPGSRRIWNQNAYHINNINEDSTVPPIEKPSWLDHNTFRANIPVYDSFTASDLTVSMLTVDDTGFPLGLDLSCRVGNGGNLVTPSAVTVSFYDGDPATGGMLIGTAVTGRSLEPGEFEDLAITWFAPHDVPWDIYAVADDIGTGSGIIEECNEMNNVASSSLDVPEALPDLRIYQSGISISPEEMYGGDIVSISADVQNIGSADTDSVVVRIFDGNPDTGGIRIGEDVTISSITVGEISTIEAQWPTLGLAGAHYLYITVDPDNGIPESQEENNRAFVITEILNAVNPDLGVGPDDFTLRAVVRSGELITLSLDVHNFGTSVSNIEVGFYNGDPLNGGVPLDAPLLIPRFLHQGDSVQVQYTLDSRDFTGMLDIYAFVDPGNFIVEGNEENNIVSKQLQIAPALLGIQVAADRTDYTASEDLIITATLTNSGVDTEDITLDIEIFDQDDNLLLSPAANDPVSVSPSDNGNTSVTFTWNTGTTIAGNYLIRARIYQSAIYIGADETQFTIIPVTTITSSVSTDQIEYTVNEPAAISAYVQSTSTNYIFENLSAEITITDSLGASLFMESHPIAALTMGQRIDFNSYWNTSANPAGDYPVTIEVKDSGDNVLSVSTTNLTISSDISPSELLIGEISVDRQSLLQGEPVGINYSVTNTGNIDLLQINLSVLIVHALELTTYDTLTDQTTLLMSETFSNVQQLDTESYSAKDYLVILLAAVSGTEETLASTYFRVEGGPSAPSLYLPTDGEDIETLPTALSVNNASDPNDDDLTYEFELYEDEPLTSLVLVSDLIEEEINITQWQVRSDLQENEWYYWRARAFDGLLYSEWMVPAAFRVNVLNDPPTAPTVSSPADGSAVDTFMPVLTVNNASDQDSEILNYNFDLALDMEFTQIVASEIGIFEGEGTTSWQASVNLSENTYYYWRSQADDWFIEGPWMVPAGFFVNTANDAPSAPLIIDPADGSELEDLMADITISNSVDAESDPLTYAFELDTVMTFDSTDLVSVSGIAGSAETTTWSVDGLIDNTRHYVRAKASDGQAESLWSEVISFFVNTINDPPSVPVLANPSDGSGVKVFTPALSVINSTDIDGDVLTYEFEVYADSGMANIVNSALSVGEMPQITSWTVSIQLQENRTYYWRGRAFDGELYSDWPTLSSFMVNTANDAPGAPTLNAPAEGESIVAFNPTLLINNAADPDSDILTYDFEIYENGIMIDEIAGIPEDMSGVTAITINNALSNNSTYQWRARAYDGDRYGSWMDMATFSVHMPVNNITATIDFYPKTLDKKSHDKWVAVYIELPDGHNINDIDVSSVALGGVIPAEPWPYNAGDDDNDGIPDLMVKFSRADVIELLPNGDEVIVEVSGLAGDVEFEGFDIIRVIKLESVCKLGLSLCRSGSRTSEMINREAEFIDKH